MADEQNRLNLLKQQTEELEKQVENLKKIIELQQKTQEHDRNLQLKHFKYEMM